MSVIMKLLSGRNMYLLLIYLWIAHIVMIGTALLGSYVLYQIKGTAFEWGLILLTMNATQAIGSFAGGPLSDRIGRKRTLTLTTLVECGTWLYLSLGKSLIDVAVAIGIMWLAWGAAYPSIVATISEIAPEKFGGALGLVNSVWSIFITLGTTVGSYTVQNHGFPTVFAIKTLVCVLSLVPLVLIRVEKPILTKKGGKGYKMREILPMLRRNVDLLLTSTALLIASFGAYCIFFYFDYVKAKFHASPFQIGIFDSIYSAVWALSNYPIGITSDRVGRKKVVVPGFLLMGMCWLAFPFSGTMAGLYVLYATYSLGTSMGYFTTAIAAELVPEERRGTALGFFNGMMWLGTCIGTLLGGILWPLFGAEGSFFLAVMTYTTAALVIGVAVREKRKM